MTEEVFTYKRVYGEPYKFTKDETRAVIDYKVGVPLKNIISIYNINPFRLYFLLKKLKIPAKRKRGGNYSKKYIPIFEAYEMYKEGKTLKAVAAHYKISSPLLAYHLKKNKLKTRNKPKKRKQELHEILEKWHTPPREYGNVI